MWPSKLNYRITTCPQSHHWGQPIKTTLKVQSVESGVEIESVRLRLQECLCLKASSKHRELFHRRDLNISEVEATEQDNDVLHLQQFAGSYNDEWDLVLPLPKSLRACRQSIHQGRITVTHNLLVDFRARDKAGMSHQVRLSGLLSITALTSIGFMSFPSRPYISRWNLIR